MRNGSRWLIATLVGASLLGATVLGALGADSDLVRIGIVTDVHAHDTNSPNEHKIMGNWGERLSAFVAAATAWPADAVISLGDFVNGRFVMGADLGEPERIEGILIEAVSTLGAFEGPAHYIVGNHDVYDLSKTQILAATGQAATYYSFDLGGFHVVILDAQYDKNENDYGHIAWMVQGLIPTAEIDWLKADLAGSDLPTVVFVHQPLDSDFELLAGGPPVANHVAVRDVLVADGDVIAVFSGHDHDADYTEIDGIHYFTIAAMVDHDEPTPLTYAFVTLDSDGRTIAIEGFGIQESYDVSY